MIYFTYPNMFDMSIIQIDFFIPFLCSIEHTQKIDFLSHILYQLNDETMSVDLL